MAMPAQELHARRRRWTLADVAALPDMPGRLRELIDGELIVSPGPAVRPQRIVAVIMEVLGRFSRDHGIGFMIGGPADVVIAAETLVQPDVLVAPLTNGTLPNDWDEMRQPLLVVEVLSPSSIRRDRVTKRALYARLGIEYWVVDPEKRIFERYMPETIQPELYEKTITWSPDGSSATLEIDIPALFAAALFE